MLPLFGMAFQPTCACVTVTCVCTPGCTVTFRHVSIGRTILRTCSYTQVREMEHGQEVRRLQACLQDMAAGHRMGPLVRVYEGHLQRLTQQVSPCCFPYPTVPRGPNACVKGKSQGHYDQHKTH